MSAVQLSAAAWKLLRELAKPDADITWAKGGGWWVADNRFSSRRTVKELLQLCLVKLTYGEVGEYEVYEITEDGRRILADPNYKPEIFKYLAREVK